VLNERMDMKNEQSGLTFRPRPGAGESNRMRGSAHMSIRLAYPKGQGWQYHGRNRRAFWRVGCGSVLWVVFLVFALLVKTAVCAPIWIGAGARIQLPTSAEWSSMINFRPGDKEVVDLDPPIFSWSYTPDPRDCASDTKPKLFVLLVSTNPTCDSGFVLQLTNRLNFYNFLPPLGRGRTYYWKVGYINPASPYSTNWTLKADSWASEPYAWSRVRQFTIKANATVWDRSRFADPVYLAERGRHPHLLLNAGNRSAVSNWIVTAMASDWSYIIRSANTTLTEAWWPDQVLPGWGASDQAEQLAKVALAWQITRNPQYTNGAVTMLTNLAWYFVTNVYGLNEVPAIADWIGKMSCIKLFRGLAYAYDWLYEISSPSQRANVVKALDRRAMYMLYGGGGLYWWTGNYKGDTNGLYEPGGLYVESSSLAKKNSSHPIDNQLFSVVGALAAFADSGPCRDWFDVAMNWLIAISYPWGFVDGTDTGFGRGYGFGTLYGSSAAGALLLASTVFPDAHLHLTPYWRDAIDWTTAWCPVLFNPPFCAWGETGSGLNIYTAYKPFGDISCRYTNGYGFQHWNRMKDYRASYESRREYYDFTYRFYWPEPPQSNAPLRQLRVAGGWYAEHTLPPNTEEAFATNGIGWIFQARPAGSQCLHDYFSDGSFEIWAYGAWVTSPGQASIGRYGHHSMAHNSILVDGLGQVQDHRGPLEPVYAKFIAYTNWIGGTYIAADLTKAYPHHQCWYGGWQYPYPSLPYNSGPLTNLLRVHRHILFLRQKYFVVFDDLAATTPRKYSIVYHVTEDTLTNLSGGSFQYTSTNLFPPAPAVRTFVWQNTDPAQLDVTVMSGTNVNRNPITGEQPAGDGKYRAHAIWTSTRDPRVEFTFLTVIYPVREGSLPPQFRRIDNLTVAVTNGAEGDVISFDSGRTNDPNVTLVVDVATIRAIGLTQARPNVPGVTRFITVNDILQPRQMADSMISRSNTVCNLLWTELLPSEQLTLQDRASEEVRLQQTFANALHRIFDKCSLLEAVQQDGVKLSEYSQALLAKDVAGKNKLKYRLNWHLFCDAFPGYLERPN